MDFAIEVIDGFRDFGLAEGARVNHERMGREDRNGVSRANYENNNNSLILSITFLGVIPWAMDGSLIISSLEYVNNLLRTVSLS